MQILHRIRTLLAVTAMLISAMPAHAQAVSGQGTWESTLLGRDINLNAVSATSNAAVYFYDTTLNVTWLRNADIAGQMDWNTAMSWASNLTTGSGATAVSDWRLPTMAANPNAAYSHDGSTAMGFNVPANSSEMASLFFSTLGNKSLVDFNGNILPTGGGLTNTGGFQNLLSGRYWSNTEFAPLPQDAWHFDNGYGYGGYQSPNGKSVQLYAMAVHPGDVGTAIANVPEPETYAMFLAGLGLIGAVARRRHSDKTLVAKS